MRSLRVNTPDQPRRDKVREPNIPKDEVRVEKLYAVCELLGLDLRHFVLFRYSEHSCPWHQR